MLAEPGRDTVADNQGGEHARGRAGSQRGAGADGSPRAARDAAAERRDQRTGLDKALAVLVVRTGARDDPATRAEPDLPGIELERPDGDVELETSHRAAVPDRAGVDLAWRRLQLVDDLNGADFRG